MGRVGTEPNLTRLAGRGPRLRSVDELDKQNPAAGEAASGHPLWRGIAAGDILYDTLEILIGRRAWVSPVFAPARKPPR